MAALSFDEFIPKDAPSADPGIVQRPSGPISFEHLVPQQQAAPVAAAAPVEPAAPQPWYTQAGQAADDVARLAASGLTLDLADNLSSRLSGRPLEQERALTQAARERAGGAGLVAEYAPMLAGPMGLSRLGVSAARAIPDALSTLATRSLASAAEGAGWGALSATGHGEDVSTGAKLGAIAGGLGNVAGEAVSGLARRVGGFFHPAAPTAAEAKAGASAAYEAADRAGVVVRPSFVSQLQQDVQGALANEAYTPRVHTGVSAVLDEIGSMQGQNVTLKGLENIRKLTVDLIKSGDPASARLGGVMRERVDDALNNMNQSHVLTGNRTEGVQALREARRGWMTSRKLEAVEEALGAATGQAESTGGSLEGGIRRRFEALLRGPQARFWTPDERRAIQQVSRMDSMDAAINLLGRLSPTSGVIPAMVSGGAALQTGGMSLPVSAAAVGAKALGDATARNRVYGLARVIANRGEMAPQLQNAVERLSETEREALGRILTGWGITNLPAMGAAAALP